MAGNVISATWAFARFPLTLHAGEFRSRFLIGASSFDCGFHIRVEPRIEVCRFSAECSLNPIHRFNGSGPTACARWRMGVALTVRCDLRCGR